MSASGESRSDRNGLRRIGADEGNLIDQRLCGCQAKQVVGVYFFNRASLSDLQVPVVVALEGSRACVVDSIISYVQACSRFLAVQANVHVRIGQTHAKQCQGEYPIADLFGEGRALHGGSMPNRASFRTSGSCEMGRR